MILLTKPEHISGAESSTDKKNVAFFSCTKLSDLIFGTNSNTDSIFFN